MGSYYIERILEEKKITDFLQERGIYPVKKSGDRMIYRCPIHTGDNDPSFIVYPIGTKGRNYQTYHCFACHSGINIINLKKDLDKISTKEAINFFLKDIDITFDEVADHVITDIQSDIQKENDDIAEEEEDKQIEILLLSVNILCREYLSDYGDEEEIQFFENKFYRKIDSIARAKDVDTLKAYHSMLIEKNVLVERAENIRKNREEEEKAAVKWRI